MKPAHGVLTVQCLNSIRDRDRVIADDEPVVRWLGCSPSILEIDPVCSRVLDSNDDGLRSMRRHAVVW